MLLDDERLGHDVDARSGRGDLQQEGDAARPDVDRQVAAHVALVVDGRLGHRPSLDRIGHASAMTTEWEAAVASVRGRGGSGGRGGAGLVALMTDEERRGCLDGDLPFWAGLTDMGKGGYHRRPFRAAQVPRLGIPGFAFSDGPRGVVIGHATCFPVSMARGRAWDLDLEERIGDAIGLELRAVGADLYGGVCVNVLRHPAWGRAQETYGEDPHHVGELGAALTRGVQRHVMATRQALRAATRWRTPASRSTSPSTTRRSTRCTSPTSSASSTKACAWVMSAYNAVNGEWCGQSHALLRDILRDEWGFDGFVISDWIFGLRDAGPSLTAGLDVEMPSPMIRRTGLDAALATGEATGADIDAASPAPWRALLRQAIRTQHRPHLDVLGGRAPGAGTRGGRQGHRAACATRRSTGPRSSRSTPAASVGSRCSAAWPTCATSATAARATSTHPTVVTPLDGLAAALPDAEVHLVTEPAGAPPTPTSPSSSSATPGPTRASSSATPAPRS